MKPTNSSEETKYCPNCQKEIYFPDEELTMPCPACSFLIQKQTLNHSVSQRILSKLSIRFPRNLGKIIKIMAIIIVILLALTPFAKDFAHYLAKSLGIP